MRKFLALVLALVMTMSLVTVSAGAATDFTDDASITSVEAVEVMNAIGILGGYPDGSFRPNASLTRGAGAKMVAYLMLGQEAADKLTATYTVFADVDDTVALAPYIEWAYAAGLVQGYGDGNFGPYNTLTEYAYGKMLLTAIGYDSAKAGYTGAGWQKAVYRDALAADIYNGTESFGACTRDTAARMSLATLEANYVVYGTAHVDGWYEVNGKWYKDAVSNVSVNGVYETELNVWETYPELEFDGNAFDVWGNPGDEWTYEDSKIGFYEDAVVKSYTTQVDYCDLLVDLGIAVSSSKKVDLTMVYNGDYNLDTDDNGDFYLANDGVAYYEIGHNASHVVCDDNFIGGQGVLTKVFKTGTNEYIVTEVATYLAEVLSVSKTHKGTTANLGVYYRDLNKFGHGVGANDRDLHGDATQEYYELSVSTSEYTKGDFVLVTLKNVWNNGVDYTKNADKAAKPFAVVDHELVTPVLGKVTGYEKAKDAAPKVGTTEIGGADEQDAFGFYAGYGLSKDASSLGETFELFYDNNGNLIGMFDPEAILTFAVVDAIWSNHADGDLTVGADIVTLDAVTSSKANVVEFNGKDLDEIDEDSYIEEKKADNKEHVYYLYTYSVDGGDYTLDKVLGSADTSYYYEETEPVTFDEGDDALYYYDEVAGSVRAIELTKTTEILMRDVNGNYTAAVGYNDAALKSLMAETAEVILDDNGLAEVVFLNNVTFLEAYVTGFIVDNDEFSTKLIDKEVYYKYTFYVGAEATTIFVHNEDLEDTNFYYGLYDVQFNAVGGNLVVKGLKDYFEADGETYKSSSDFERTTVAKADSDEGKIKLGTDGWESMNGVLVYEVDMTSSGTTLTAVEPDYLDSLANTVKVDTIRNDDDELTAIYVLKFN